jgi:transketolase
LANLVILCPGDPIETSLATKAMLKYNGPVYLRLGKAGEPNVHKTIPNLEIGKGILINDGKDITIIGTSTLLYRAWEVANKLKEKGISIRLISMPTINPLDSKIVIESAKKTQAIFTLEEHSIIGGLGSAVAETIAENKLPVIFKRIGVPDHFTKVIGNQEYMREANGLSVEKIVETILKSMKI